MKKRFLEQMNHLVGDPYGHRYLLAVSGGADSCVMAQLFCESGLNFALAHCNFHLRGEDSNQDMQLVQELAKRWDVEIFVKEFDTLALQKDSGKSVEMVARELRYAWFAEIMANYDFLATAHQADDALETTLLNLCRGTGIKGLASIPERNGNIIRPMLVFSAEEIRNYAQSHNIAFAIDCTNDDESIRRNKIRKSVIPLLATQNPNLIHTYSHNRKILQKQLAFYNYYIEKEKEKIVEKRDETVIVHIDDLQGHPHRDLIVYEILDDFGFPADIANELCARDPQTGTQYHSATHTLLVNRREYLIRPHDNESFQPITIRSMEELQHYFTVERLTNNGKIDFDRDNHTLYLAENDLMFPMTIDTWQAGDYFYPLGGKGKQKVSDFFTDHKIDRFTKQQVRLLKMDENIVWIIGYRSDQRYKIDPIKTQVYFKIQYNGIF
ncbi:MAG: tRNA lysidine(34) synthetase TilS [Bacteroidales bacterium]|nr:tRNA lysidine(34) synthetase TilS [Bacteroidales bacterium]